MKSSRCFLLLGVICILAIAEAVQKVEPFLGIPTSKLPSYLKPSLWPPAPLKTVSELDIEAYQGRWYQYSSSIVPRAKRFFGGCVTFEHKLLAANNQTSAFRIITRSNVLYFPLLQQSSKVAISSDEVGKFMTTYSSPLSARHYWVVGLGPKVEGKYQYSIVTSSNSADVRVLVRDLESFPTKYKKDVDAKLKELDLFALVVKQMKTKHNSCKYEWSTPETSSTQIDQAE